MCGSVLDIFVILHCGYLLDHFALGEHLRGSSPFRSAGRVFQLTLDGEYDNNVFLSLLQFLIQSHILCMTIRKVTKTKDTSS